MATRKVRSNGNPYRNRGLAQAMDRLVRQGYAPEIAAQQLSTSAGEGKEYLWAWRNWGDTCPGPRDEFPFGKPTPAFVPAAVAPKKPRKKNKIQYLKAYRTIHQADLQKGQLVTSSELRELTGEEYHTLKAKGFPLTKVSVSPSDTEMDGGRRFALVASPAKAKTAKKRTNPAPSPKTAAKGSVWLVELWLKQRNGGEMESDVGICTNKREAQLVMAEVAQVYASTSSLTITQQSVSSPMVAQPKNWIRITATKYPLDTFVG